MTSFPGLGAPPFGFLQSAAWRAVLALLVVFVMLATTGWTAVRGHKDTGDPLASARTAWAHATLRGRHLPDPLASPGVLAGFFASLGRVDRAALVTRYPLAVGNMSGAPLALRYRANRIALDQARAVERRRTADRRLTPVGRQEAAHLADRFAAMRASGRQILAFDPAGGGRAAEVFGDLAHARRVSVVVPGVDTNLSTFERVERPMSAPAGMGRSLYAAERAARPGTRTAVIAWADYTAPAGLGIEAVTGQLAAAGAVRLRALVDGLPRSAAVALFCHSYGSVVCGVAARNGLPPTVRDIVVAGSPGMRVPNAAALHTRGRIWATRDADDWIQDVPYLEIGGIGHGADPVAPGFGARVLSAAGAEGHAGYFVPGSGSLRNFALVGVGAFGGVTCAADDRYCAADLS
ncbi:alpha/beta hydrolase [Streptomyces sp. NPDC003077]|uniref:alpha/beta hydrolase n=1 Tax=Streptomyces sp. NPDC003077 TaxID=3154443 RepID=UPI0033B13099